MNSYSTSSRLPQLLLFSLLTVVSAALNATTYTYSTLAGLVGGYAVVDGTGSAARFKNPLGSAFDASGNIFMADYYGNCIRKITPSGVVTTFAGSTTAGNADGNGTSATFSGPWAVAFDSNGNLFVTDTGNSLVRKITSSGQVTTFAGGNNTYQAYDGTGTAAQFSQPKGIAIDSSNNMYVCDSGYNSIRVITPTAVVTTFAGPGYAATSGNTDGSLTAARFSNPAGICGDSMGNFYVSDSFNHTVRKLSSSGTVSTLAGMAGVSGTADGTGSSARFYIPFAITTDAYGNVIVADTYNRTFRSVSQTGAVTTIGGVAGSTGSADGVGSNARFNYPFGVFLGSNGVIAIGDSENFLARTATVSGSTQTPVITSAQTTACVVNTYFSYTITATNSPTQYSCAGNDLPTGLTFNSSSGVISGTPTAIQTKNAAISATNSYGSGGATLTITITGPPPVVTSATTVNTNVGSSFYYQITATNSPTSFDYANIPPYNGSYSHTTGYLSGTPVTAGTYYMTVYASNSGGTGSAVVTVNVGNPINNVQWDSIDTPSSGTVGGNVTITAHVTNIGGTTWDNNYFIEIKDADGNHLAYPSISGTGPGQQATASASITLQKGGDVTYYLTAMQSNVEYFGGTQATSSISVTGWWWQTLIDGNGDLKMQSMHNSTTMFDFNVGAGGCISTITYSPTSTAILAPTYLNSVTDRVIQFTVWNDDLYAVNSGYSNQAFNENTAGSGPDAGGSGPGGEYFAPVVSVTRSGNVVDVYAVPKDNYIYGLNAWFTATLPCLTRYEMLANGVLKIRRVVLFTNIAISAGNCTDRDLNVYTSSPLSNYSHLWFESWTPFIGGAMGFNACASAIDANGAPSQSYDWDYITNHQYSGIPVYSTYGYAMAYQSGAYSSQPVAAMVYGTNDWIFAASATHTTAPTPGQYGFNLYNWGTESQSTGDAGLALLPAVDLHNVEAGSVIDYTMYIVLRGLSDSSLSTVLQSTSTATPAPVLYAPDYQFSGELGTIVTTLQANLSQSGTRTRHLGTLLN